VKLGMVGLGRMGAGMTARLERGGHTVQTYDPQVDSTAGSLEELAQQLEPPRAVWMMVPAGDVTEQVFRQLLGILEPDDTIVDGGNSYFRDSLRRGEEAGQRDLHFIEAGVSGGVWGLKEGFCLMVGGDEEAGARLEPVFLTLAPEGGYAHVGKGGAGHFVKMVHNGIEYGIMQSYAEGFELLEAAHDFGLDLRQIAALWNEGSVVRSWLLELLETALEQHPGLDGIRGYVEDSGEGRWTVQEAVEHAVPLPAITAALFARFRSRQDESFAAKVNAALRGQFGGHVVPTDE
jgi:6-phosphogluconate dehydrogenase